MDLFRLEDNCTFGLVDLFGVDTRADLARRLIVVYSTLNEFFLRCPFLRSVRKGEGGMAERSYSVCRFLLHEHMFSRLTPLNLQKLVKLEHAPFAAEVSLAAFMEQRLDTPSALESNV